MIGSQNESYKERGRAEHLTPKKMLVAFLHLSSFLHAACKLNQADMYHPKPTFDQTHFDMIETY